MRMHWKWRFMAVGFGRLFLRLEVIGWMNLRRVFNGVKGLYMAEGKIRRSVKLISVFKGISRSMRWRESSA